MSNRTEAATRKQRHGPPGGYSHCACSRLHQRGPSLCGWEAGPSPFCYVMHYRPIGVVGDSMSAALYIVLEKQSKASSISSTARHWHTPANFWTPWPRKLEPSL
jgi:hypothetical protein